MKNPVFRKAGVVASILVVSVLWLSGCVHYGKGHKFKPIPIQNVAIGLNFTDGGRVIFVDQNGEIVKPVTLKDQIDRKYQEGTDWEIEEVKTITLFYVKGSHEIWIHIDGESICLLYNDAWQFEGRCN